MPAAERLAHLPPGPRSLRRVRAELEGAAVHATDSRSGGCRGANGEPGAEGRPVPGDARRQVVPVRAVQAPFAVARLVPAVREVRQQEQVGDQLLGAPVQRSPPGGWRDPQPVLAVGRPLACLAGTYLPDHAALVDPHIALRVPGLQCQDGELGCLADERMRFARHASMRIAVRTLTAGDVKPMLNDGFGVGVLLSGGMCRLL